MILTSIAYILDNFLLQTGFYTIEKTGTLCYWVGKKIYHYYYPPKDNMIELQEEIKKLQYKIDHLN